MQMDVAEQKFCCFFMTPTRHPGPRDPLRGPLGTQVTLGKAPYYRGLNDYLYYFGGSLL